MAIGTINNTESGVSVRSKLNAVIGLLNDSTMYCIYAPASDFTTNNPVLEERWVGIETDTITTLPKFKIADGVTAWNDLPYVSDSSIQSLQDILLVGNTTGPTPIIVSAGSYIASPNSKALLFLENTYFQLYFDSGLATGGVTGNGANTKVWHQIQNTFESPLHKFNNNIEVTAGYIQSILAKSRIGLYDNQSVYIYQNGSILAKLEHGDYLTELNYTDGFNGGSHNISATSNQLSHTALIELNASDIVVSQEPTMALGISTKSYVDNMITGLSWKKSVLYSTTTGENLSLTGLSITIDGTLRTLLTTDRILVKNQTVQSQNGIYNPASGAWTRVIDADSNTEILSATVYVREGSIEVNRVYSVQQSPIALGTTNITFALISGAGTYINGTYLKLTGNVFDLDFTTFSTAHVTEGSNLYFTNARVLAALLTGYSASAGAVTSSDSVLSALEKIAGNIATKADIQNGLYSGGAITVLTIDGTGTNNDIRVAAANWIISLVHYSTAGNTDFLNITLAASGLQRFVGIYGDNTNTITIVDGSESEYAVYPSTPVGKALIGYVLVTDSATSSTPDLSGYMLISSKASIADAIAETDDTKYWTSLTGSAKTNKNIAFNTQTASYTLVMSDRDKHVEMNVASANNLTVPLNSSVAFPIGTQIIGSQYGAGQTTIVATGGVTIRSFSGLKSMGQYAGWTLEKRGTNEWYAFGTLTV